MENKSIVLILMALNILGIPSWAGSDYFPYDVGYHWKMDAKFTSGEEEGSGFAENIVLEMKEIGGISYYKQKTLMLIKGKRPLGITLYVRVADEGLYYLASEDETEYLAIPFPLKPGNKWTTTEFGTLFHYEVIDIRNLTIKGQVYEKSIHIRKHTSDGALIEDFWVAPQLGVVKSVILMNQDRIEITLNEFTKKAAIKKSEVQAP